MRIVVDAMGGDNAPREIVLGCLNALNRDTRLTIALVGKQDIIHRVLEGNTNGRLEVIDAAEVITNEESPVEAIRRKKASSMVAGMDIVKRGEAEAFISAGNTGALMAGALFRIGRIEGIDRPALAPIIPTLSGGSMLIDAGANADCKPKNLLQFGLMGSAYMERVAGIAKPRVALVNVGSEKGKGNQLTKEAFELLEASNLNFIGNIEARDIPEGKAEVLVCDGFVGNVILKLTEGLAMSIFSELKKEFTANTAAKLAAAVLKPGLKRFKARLDYKEYGGAALLGVSGGCIKAHGSSDAKAIESAVFQAVKFVDMQVIDKIKEEI
ncbi:MAG: Phosphate:acyl-ACP acyltransferase PlsX (EC 2.3.1.n2) [Firmicutes bacterium]|nr:Phosphate:acyl-ACP acyltransferase PlsX (EC 2.3.1.n2) [Bacillota bacterium]MDI6704631.1 phosphate acyltransferase PlsX [Bacillota bacterium]